MSRAAPATGPLTGCSGTISAIGDACGPIAAGLLVATVGYARMLQIMAFVVFTMALLLPLAVAVLLGAPGMARGAACRR